MRNCQELLIRNIQLKFPNIYTSKERGGKVILQPTEKSTTNTNNFHSLIHTKKMENLQERQTQV